MGKNKVIRNQRREAEKLSAGLFFAIPQDGHIERTMKLIEEKTVGKKPTEILAIHLDVFRQLNERHQRETDRRLRLVENLVASLEMKINKLERTAPAAEGKSPFGLDGNSRDAGTLSAHPNGATE